MTDDPRLRVLDATLAAVAERGIADVQIGDVAQRAHVGRSTLYRLFPGGRDELLRAAVAHEQRLFLIGLRDAVDGSPDLPTLFERGLRYGRHAIDTHALLQAELAREPELLLPLFGSGDAEIRSLIAGFLLEQLERAPVRPGLDLPWIADELARIVISLIGSHGTIDTDDDAALRSFVRDHLLVGVLRSPAASS